MKKLGIRVVVGLCVLLVGGVLLSGCAGKERINEAVSPVLSTLVTEYYQKTISEGFGVPGLLLDVKISNLILVEVFKNNYTGTADAYVKFVGDQEAAAGVLQFLPGLVEGNTVKVQLSAVADNKNVLVSLISVE